MSTLIHEPAPPACGDGPAPGGPPSADFAGGVSGEGSLARALGAWWAARCARAAPDGPSPHGSGPGPCGGRGPVASREAPRR